MEKYRANVAGDVDRERQNRGRETESMEMSCALVEVTVKGTQKGIRRK